MISFEHSAASQNYFSAIGCLYDLVGAGLLARALAFVKPKQLDRQSSSGYGGFSTPLLKMFSEQKIDASLGLVLLTIGFALQMLSGYGWKTVSSEFAAISIFLLALVFVGYLRFRQSLVKRLFVAGLRSLKDHKDTSKQRLPDDTIESLWATEQDFAS